MFISEIGDSFHDKPAKTSYPVKPVTSMANYRSMKSAQSRNKNHLSASRIVTASSELKLQQEKIDSIFYKHRNSDAYNTKENLASYLDRLNKVNSKHRKRMEMQTASSIGMTANNEESSLSRNYSR